MIAFLRGNISSLSENSIIIDVSGVGYNCIVSANTYDFFLNKIKQEIVILTYHHINESTQSLFGFHDEDERGVFKLLIGVSGVGPKTAIQFLSSTSAKELKDKIKSTELESAQELLSDPEPWEDWESKLVIYSILIAIIGLVILGALINWLVL